jgi:hypothetical protein
MPRYATIITGDDGAEIVSAIGEFESAHPPRGLGGAEQVAPGVRIGMVRGGPVDVVGGFGFPLQGLGRAAIADARAKLAALKPPVSLQAEVSSRADPALTPRPARSKPRKKPVRKAAQARSVRQARTAAPDAAANG